MRLKIAIGRRSRRRDTSRRWWSFAASLSLHFTTAAALLSIRVTIQRDLLEETKYQVVRLPAQHDNKLQWYDLHQAIPEVAPQHTFGAANVPQGEKDSRTLIAHSPAPESTLQLVQQPDPAPLPHDIVAPNIVSAPPKTAPRQFVLPPLQPTPRVPEPTKSLEPAPVLESPVAVKPFGPEVSVLKLPPRRFVAPVQKADDKNRSSVPQIIDRAAPDIQAAIVGLQPAERLLATIPAGSRPAEFARAPVQGAVSSGAASATAPKVADLATRGANARASVPPPAASKPLVVKETTFRTLNRTMSAPLRPSSRVIPPSVEAQFANRNVYTFVIPDVGQPGYSGDWVLWFAEDTSSGNQLARISAPVPAKKYALADTAEFSGDPPIGAIQIAARIDKTGGISEARVLRGPPQDILRRRAIEELETWEFAPALRNGEPIGVDVVVELPFRPDLQQVAH